MGGWDWEEVEMAIWEEVEMARWEEEEMVRWGKVEMARWEEAGDGWNGRGSNWLRRRQRRKYKYRIYLHCTRKEYLLRRSSLLIMENNVYRSTVQVM
jgi:hypothetical protein